MFVYIVMLFNKLIIRDDDKVNYQYPDVPTEELGEISYKEAYGMMFIELGRPQKYGEEARKAENILDRVKFDEDFK